MGQIPGTSWLQGKFMPNRTPYEEYVHNQVTSTEFADWTSPYQAFVQPFAHQTFDFVTPGSTYVPSHVEKSREVEEYYDKIKYVKARKLQVMAEASGNAELAGHYANEQQQTVVGIPHTSTGINKNVYKAVPYNMRPYVSSIAQATPGEADKFRDILPIHQRKMWDQVWAANLNKGSVPTDDNPRMRADEEIAEYFSSRQAPADDSAIWNPDVDIDEYKLRTLEQEGLSYFQEGIPEAKARTYRQLDRAELVLDSSPFEQDMEHRNNLLEKLQGTNEISQYNVKNSMIKSNNNVYYNDPDKMRLYNQAGEGRF
jgi:hypothetical protein